jgi:oligopeptide transport system ATP-binding protein
MKNQGLNDEREAILTIDHASVDFVFKKRVFWERATVFHAVRDVSFSVRKGEILGIVGESGSGKTTLAKAIVGLVSLNSGKIEFHGTALESKRIRPVQMVFQNPFASLNPRLTVYEALTEAVRMRSVINPGKQICLNRVKELLSSVGLDGNALYKYPHEFSGGQCQRIALARALASDPKLIVADEIVSALDVSVQAQILNLLKKLVSELDLTLLFIGHDLSVMKYLTDRIAVMHQGSVVEIGDTEAIFEYPQHVYTQRLLGALR